MKKYHMDWDLLYKIQRKDELAVVLVRISGDGAAAVAEKFIDGLYKDCNGVAGSGGWAIHPVDKDQWNGCAKLEIVAGGQDVADAIEDATDRLYAFVAGRDCEIEWKTSARP